jgi:hypothetical protein
LSTDNGNIDTIEAEGLIRTGGEGYIGKTTANLLQTLGALFTDTDNVRVGEFLEDADVVYSPITTAKYGDTELIRHNGIPLQT